MDTKLPKMAELRMEWSQRKHAQGKLVVITKNKRNMEMKSTKGMKYVLLCAAESRMCSTWVERELGGRYI